MYTIYITIYSLQPVYIYIKTTIKTINHFSCIKTLKSCHATEKSEAIARVQGDAGHPIPVNRVVDTKRIIRKREGQGGGVAQRVADQKTTTLPISASAPFLKKLEVSRA
jgi:SH3-like domain-containing protein